MNYKNLILEIKNKVAVITINRPEKLNALNYETMNEIEDVIKLLNSNEEARVIIITGSGDKAFVAGADISELNKLDMISGKTFAERGQTIFNLIENSNKPVIAAVNGYALGGGSELALACHFRVASENAKFGQPEVNLGIIPGYGGTQRLSRLIGAGRAMEYILTAEQIDVNEAYRIGLVNHIFPKNELLQKTIEIAEKITSKPEYAISFAIKAVNSYSEMTKREGLNYEASLFALCCGTEDFKEGTSAFLEKRKPAFGKKK